MHLVSFNFNQKALKQRNHLSHGNSLLFCSVNYRKKYKDMKLLITEFMRRKKHSNHHFRIFHFLIRFSSAICILTCELSFDCFQLKHFFYSLFCFVSSERALKPNAKLITKMAASLKASVDTSNGPLACKVFFHVFDISAN